ncbi:VOC family protein [Veronia pacifica]|uniref:Bleomycin resistance protein n=1 Tax=Veronia pacifica TaxID=1080227 RepID=A0A1C3E7J4_9GAMM|nr:glyoxalase/bleomycin resistance/extradiol dioxygenase family protein [Veronia pacifica]ODA29212.1 bleomycin resistance protein [Veronia pacifica]
MFSNVSIKASLAEGHTAFYQNILGMTSTARGWRFNNQGASLSFTDIAQPYQPKPQDFFWKIGVTVVNLDLAYQWLRQHGVFVTEPSQFKDIGYLAHLSDPSGMTIELLQTTFSDSSPSTTLPHPISSGATVAHISVRCHDRQHMLSWCQQQGLILKSIQPVTDYGFTLYFFSWIDEPLPDSELTAVANREWLWQRPYTLLEFQLIENQQPFLVPGEGGAGLFEVVSDNGLIINSQCLTEAGLAKG